MGDRRNTGDHNLNGQPGQSTQSQDWVALDWVRGEITDTLAQARQSLEAYVETPQDDTRLRFLPELYSSDPWHSGNGGVLRCRTARRGNGRADSGSS